MQLITRFSPYNLDCLVEQLTWSFADFPSIKIEENIDVIHDEIKEELGFEIDKNKLIYVNSRQLAGTLSSHKSHLYKLELTDEEMNNLKNDKGVHGVIEDTEMTYIEVMTLKEILSSNLLDWTNIGMIMNVLNNL